ncbi:Leucine aminopeptidase [Mycena sanguinolenta]|uniref:Leucine aminopeptidase n=1 Tax=Mycena sanguinolenta TaxID=230812 RepID=A0A8H7CKI6_9AGAR|nr:Leucine aminopeptidase [Mycena sanguinolenta]
MIPRAISSRLAARVCRKMTTSASIYPFDPKAPSKTVSELWTASVAKEPKVGTTRIFFSDKITALSSLGPNWAKKNAEGKRELVRRSVGSAVKEIKSIDEVTEVVVDASVDPHAAAVAAHLALYDFTLKTDPPSAFNPNLKEPLPPKIALKPLDTSPEWDQGVVYAKAQNLARTLMELPGNMMTPTIFCQRAQAEFAGVENVEIFVRDEAWAAQKGMRTFLSVTRGSAEPAKFLEIHYQGATSPDAKPLVLVGKGITFDTGGISLKPGGRHEAHARRHGRVLTRSEPPYTTSNFTQAAQPPLWQLHWQSRSSSFRAINVVVLTPLAENMPSGTATKPGDIIYAMNGKSVEVDNTDAEGRLVLSDAIYYGSTEFNAHTLIDVATLTSAMDIALGEVFTGVFTTSDALWERLHAAGETEYDRLWRMPVDEDYGPQIYSSNADLQNTGGKPAGSCTAALFLKAFVHGLEPTDGSTPLAWAHIDTAGTMEATRPTPYLGRGMTGSSVR